MFCNHGDDNDGNDDGGDDEKYDVVGDHLVVAVDVLFS